MEAGSSKAHSAQQKFDQFLTLIPYILRYKKKVSIGIFFIVVGNVLGLFQPILLQQAIDTLRDDLQTSTMLLYGLLILAFAIAEGVFTFLKRQTIIVVSRHIEYDLRNDFFRHLQKMSMRFFQKYRTGDMMARSTNDLNAVRAIVGPGIMYFCNTIILFIGTLSVMFYLNPKLSALALLPMLIMVLMVYKLMQKIYNIFKDSQEKFSEITAHVQENITGIRVVKAYVQEEMEKGRFAVLNEDYIALNMQLAKIRSALWAGMTFFTGIAAMIVLWVGGDEVAAQELSLGALVAFFALLTRLTWPMIALGWVMNLTQQGIASMSRINEILHTEPEITTQPGPGNATTTIKGNIEFRDVCFEYDREPVLKNINLRIEQGKTLAIVGSIGSGKTTLLNLIPRLFDANSGQILIDGTPIQQIPVDVLRRNIGYVTQETFLFSETIAENINFGIENPVPAQTTDAAKASQLYKDIDAFPDKLETMLGERGINMSGGQKQRAAISRAVIREPSILLLDDALSAVDTYTEEKILHHLRGVMRNRTSIIISHRISTIRDADEIIVIEDGRIVEKGGHEGLLKKAGFYADLFKKQQLEEELADI